MPTQRRRADEALLATLPPALVAEAQALQARLRRHSARGLAMQERMEEMARQVGVCVVCVGAGGASFVHRSVSRLTLAAGGCDAVLARPVPAPLDPNTIPPATTPATIPHPCRPWWRLGWSLETSCRCAWSTTPAAASHASNT